MEKLKKALIFIAISCILIVKDEAKIENTITLHFYVQNIGSGPNATVFTVATSSITSESPTRFGQVTVLDDKLTAAPELDSAEVGRLQGIAASADLRVRAMSQTLNFLFTSEEYGGSTIVVVGRNEVGAEEREMAVVGGTGAFRSARGYAITTTYPNEDVENRTVLEYWIYVTLF